MKIERGILCVNTSNEIVVRSPLKIHRISMESLLERYFKSNENMLGVLINEIFYRCEEFEFLNGERVFGYITKNDLANSKLTIQLIENFNQRTFDPFNPDYMLGKEIIVNKNDVDTWVY